MLRCVFALLLVLCAALPAQAQRVFQANALRGELVVTQPPEALLNGRPVRMAPGLRIRNPLNMIQLSGSLLDQKLAVNYTLDGAGELREVWILSQAELAKKPWPTTPQEAQRWVFDSTLQRWSKP
ncbi:MAG: hypothetical protein Q8L49_06160 [Burkholderiaceae bacterium]|nr:hypothetical protein [Burkholderiaceae bacterium]